MSGIGWNFSPDLGFTKPVVELKSYEILPYETLNVELETIGNYMSSTHSIEIFSDQETKYKLYSIQALKIADDIKTIVSKMGDNLDIEIDTSFDYINNLVFLNIKNNNPFQVIVKMVNTTIRKL